MSVLQDFRRIADALERLAATQTRAVTEAAERHPSEERLDDLELGRSRFEAEMEGLLMKAEGKLKAASNAEARERHQRRQYEAELDPFSEDSEEVQRRLQDVDAEGLQEEEVQPLHLGLETNSKAHALRAKWMS